jgi:hypothetical protein|tara:strand:- start:828 stop:1316 length:489 start_codon:yes stop_codon:yes gene_type:complete
MPNLKALSGISKRISDEEERLLIEVFKDIDRKIKNLKGVERELMRVEKTVHESHEMTDLLIKKYSDKNTGMWVLGIGGTKKPNPLVLKEEIELRQKAYNKLKKAYATLTHLKQVMDQKPLQEHIEMLFISAHRAMDKHGELINIIGFPENKSKRIRGNKNLR